MIFSKLLFFLVLLFPLIDASGRSPKTYTELDMAMSVCTTFISKYGAVCKSTGKKGVNNMKCYCNQKSGFGTLSDCFVRGYNNDSSLIGSFVRQCNSTTEHFYHKYTSIQEEFVANGTEYAEKKKKTEKTAPGNETISEVPLLLNYKALTPYRKAYTMYYNNFNLSLDYGAILLGYWAGVLLIAITANMFTKMFPKTTSKIYGKVSNTLRKHVILPATFTKKKAQSHSFGLGGFFDCLIPTRLETLTIVVFVLLTGFLSALHIHHTKDNPQYATKNAELGHMIADRTGILVSYFIPLLILFGGRNNFLQWLSGWDFATFIMYHRWISRLSILLVIVHAIAFSVSDKATGKYAVRMTRPFMIWGTVSCICGGFILLQAMLFFRRKCYEVFFLIHIILAVFFVVGAFFHLDDMGYGDFMWASIAIWAFDRVVRLGRIIVFGARKAEVTVKGDETLKIVVPKPKYWKSIAGGHAFIHFLKPTLFLQSHPFTFTTTESDDKIVLYAKIKNGITNNIYKYVSRRPGGTATIRVLVEGPYGEASGAGRTAKNLVYLAGGNGIPGIYSECIDVAKKSRDQSIKLLWVIRNWKSLSWFVEELEYLKKTNIQPVVYVTQPNCFDGLECFTTDDGSETKPEDEKDKSSLSTDSESILSNIKSNLTHVTFVEGRPEIKDIIENEVSTANGPIAFVTCGHPAMVDDIRYYCSQHITNANNNRVEFHEQLQTWA